MVAAGHHTLSPYGKRFTKEKMVYPLSALGELPILMISTPEGGKAPGTGSRGPSGTRRRRVELRDDVKPSELTDPEASRIVAGWARGLPVAEPQTS